MKKIFYLLILLSLHQVFNINALEISEKGCFDSEEDCKAECEAADTNLFYFGQLEPNLEQTNQCENDQRLCLCISKPAKATRLPISIQERIN